MKKRMEFPYTRRGANIVTVENIINGRMKIQKYYDITMEDGEDISDIGDMFSNSVLLTPH